MVGLMRPEYAQQKVVLRPGEPFGPAMYQYIVDQKVQETVHADANPHPKPVIQVSHSKDNQHNGHAPEQQGKEVIELEWTLGRLMMCFVDIPKRAMHQVFVYEPPEDFHRYKTKRGEQYSSYHIH